MNRNHFLRRAGLLGLGLGTAPLIASDARNLPSYDKEKCEKIWKLLCGKSAEKAPFRYIDPDPSKANVLIYGDSISIGYTETVREVLKDKANIFRIHLNGGPTYRFRMAMEQLEKAMFEPWLAGGWSFKWDLIHFNVGLHDFKYQDEKGKYDKINGTVFSTPQEYEKGLSRVCAYLRDKFPDTQLIFATTTPVPENAGGRYAGDSVKYNDIARKVLKKYPTIAINDLYAFTKPHYAAWCIKPNNVHYNDLGKDQQGKEVARVISETLDP